jgi:hypothetical protein
MAEVGTRSLRRTAGLGVPLAALAAVASAKTWRGGAPTDTLGAALDTGQRAPLASAVSLVLLAAWGVLLVTRGPVRRVFAVVALVAAVGLVAAVVAAWFTLPGSGGTSYDELVGRRQDTGWTGWFCTAGVCALLSLVPAAVAVRRVREWPEMGRRYDAPGAVAPVEEPRTERDLWDQLDEGRDPTDPS